MKVAPGQWKILNIAPRVQVISIKLIRICKPLFFASFSNSVNSIIVEIMINKAEASIVKPTPGQCAILKIAPRAKKKNAIVGIFVFMFFILNLVHYFELEV